jgi:hypothetical protein
MHKEEAAHDETAPTLHERLLVSTVKDMDNMLEVISWGSGPA